MPCTVGQCDVTAKSLYPRLPPDLLEVPTFSCKAWFFFGAGFPGCKCVHLSLSKTPLNNKHEVSVDWVSSAEMPEPTGKK